MSTHGGASSALWLDSDRAYPQVYGTVSPAGELLRGRALAGAHVSDITHGEAGRRFVAEDCAGDLALARSAFREIWPHLPVPTFGHAPPL